MTCKFFKYVTYSVYCASVLLSAGQTNAEKTGTMLVRVQVADSEEPLKGAYVLVGGTGLYSPADSSGSCRFLDVKPDVYRVLVSHIGYISLEQEVEVQSAEVTKVVFKLTANPNQLDPIVVTGTRTPRPVSQSPFSTHVIEKHYRPTGQQTAADLLRSVSGIDISGGGAPGLMAGVSLRGSSPSQTLVMLDGVRLNMAGKTSTLGGVDLSEIGVDHIDRIEVIKGPGSALYGSDAGGGVIQIFSQTVNRPRVTRVSLTTGGGKCVDDCGSLYATQRYHVFHGRRQRSWQWTAEGSVASNGGHIENTDAQVWNAMTRLIHHRTNGQTAANLFLSRRRGGSPGAEGQGQLTTFDIDDRQNNDVVRLSLSDRRQLHSGMQFEANSTVHWWQVNRINPIVQKGELAGNFSAKHQLWTLEPRVDYTRHYLRPLTVGAEYRFQRQHDGLFGIQTAHVLAMYVQNRFEIGAHEVEVGVRLDDHSLYGNQLNPRMSIAARLHEGLVLRSALGRAFVSPSFDDIFRPTELFPQAIGDVVGETSNLSLQPEFVWTADIGIRWQMHQLQGEATVYQSRYRNLIQPSTVMIEIDSTMQPFLSLSNIAKAHITGVEFSKRVRIQKQSELQINYTFQRAFDADATGVNRNLQGRLRQKLSGDYHIDIGESDPIRLSLRADWQERYIDEGRYFNQSIESEGIDEDGEELEIGSPEENWRYLTLGLSCRYRLTKSIILQTDVTNLLDERYQTVFGIPQPGLIATAGLKLTLD